LAFPANRLTLGVVDPLYDVVQLTVIRKNMMSNTTLGSVFFPVFLVSACQPRVLQWWPLRKNANDRTERGSVLIDVAFGAANAKPSAAISLVPQLKLPLSVRVLEAMNLSFSAADEVADLHAVVGFGHGKHIKEETTETRRKTQFPVFNDLFSFVCTDISESVRVHLFANGKSIGHVAIPVTIMLVALQIVARERSAISLDFWWPLLERRALIQSQNGKRMGLVHLVIYLGGSTPQLHQAQEEPPAVLKSSAVKKLNTKDSWDKRQLVLKKGGKLPPHCCIYKSDADAKADANGTLVFLMGARLPDKLDVVKKHAGRVLCVRECISKDTKPRTFLFDTIAECDAWREALKAARNIPPNWFDRRLTGSSETNQPTFVSIQEAVRGVDNISLPYLRVDDENDDTDFQFGTSKFIVAPSGAPIGIDSESGTDTDYASALLADDEDGESGASTGEYGSAPPEKVDERGGEYGSAPPERSSASGSSSGYDKAPPLGANNYGSLTNLTNSGSSGYGVVPMGATSGSPSGYGTVPTGLSGYGSVPPAINSSRNQLPAAGSGYGKIGEVASGYSAPPAAIAGDGYAKAPPPAMLEEENDKKKPVAARKKTK
jgi:hypothetical protein